MSGRWERVKVLLTGGGGFVGSWLAVALADAGASVACLVRSDPRGSSLDLLGVLPRVCVVEGSTADYPRLAQAVTDLDIEVCFHLAAQPLVAEAAHSPLDTFESNARGTWNVLEACRASGRVRGVVVASSDRAYGDHDDTTALHPYDASKACTEVLARSYFRTYRLPVAITRFVNIYGGGDAHASRLIPGAILSVLEGRPPVIESDGTPEREYLHVEDAVQGYLRMAERMELGAAGEVFDFRSGNPVSVRKVIELIVALSDHPDLTPTVLGRRPSGGSAARVVSSARARSLLGWSPSVDLADGLKRTYLWYREHRYRMRVRA